MTPPRKRATSAKRSARTPAAKKAAPPPANPADKAPPGHRVWLLDGTYDDRATLQHHGARWWPTYGWAYTGPALPAALEPWRPRRYSWTEFIERSKVHRAGPTGNPAVDETTGTITLRPDQLDDVNTIVEAHRRGCPEFALASLVGTGKTVTTIAAAKRLPGVRRILVVMPLGVMPAWRRTLRDMGDGGKEWVFLNYQSTKRLLDQPAAARSAKKQATKNRIVASKGTPHTQWDLVICDESQWLGNPASQQSRVVDRAIEGPHGKPAFIIRMSATLANNPSQLAYLHRGLAWRTSTPSTGSITPEGFVEWCRRYGLHVEQSYGNNLSWTARGNPAEEASDIRKVRHLLFGGSPAWALRRVPDWPEQQRFLAPVDLTAAESAAYDVEWARFDAAMKNLRDAERSQARTIDDPRAHREATAAANAARRAGKSAGERYQQKAGLLRVPGTVDFIDTFLSKGVQVAAYCRHLVVLNELHRLLLDRNVPTAVYTGQNRDTREEQRVAYQQGRAKVILYTTSEGLNLHAGEKAVSGNNVPRVGLIAQPHWSPRASLQAEGRSQRDGTNAPCYYTYAAGTVEERVLESVLPAMRTVLAMMGDDTTALESLTADLGIPLIGV